MIHFHGRFLIAASTAMLLLTSCSAHRQLATQAVGFNLTVEQAQNEMLLLNVIRAKDRLPMYLTGISGLSGNVQTTLTTGLTGTYTRQKQDTRSATPQAVSALTRAYTPSFGTTLSKNPSFTLAVLDTQEFIRGFLTPLGKETLAHYWMQDWPPELLIYLFVQRIEIAETGKPLVVLRNYPDSLDPDVTDLKAFAGWVHQGFLAQKPQIEEVQVPVNIGPMLPEAEVTNLEKLVALSKEGLVLEKAGSQYQLQRRQTDFRFRLASERRERSEQKLDQAQQQQLVQEPERMYVSQDTGATTTFLLRSPEALLYYLGELARLANRNNLPLVPYICIQGQYQPIFVALPAGTCADNQIEADTGQERFSVPTADLADAPEQCEAGALRLEKPACKGGRSMQALRLLNQVISLQKSAKDLPSTALVRVID